MGRKPLNKHSGVINESNCVCVRCGKKYEYDNKAFFSSDSDFYKNTNKIPCCKECVDELYAIFLDRYKGYGYKNPEKKAVERICMSFDIWFNDELLNKVTEKMNLDSISYTTSSLISRYIQSTKLYQYRDKDYDTTVREKIKAGEPIGKVVDEDVIEKAELEEAVRKFGNGFSTTEYKFLMTQYKDWTTRHECETKSQEEVFKRLCFSQLDMQRAIKSGADTKDLNTTFMKLLDTAKLQPKQNNGDSTSKSQTFGTLIDKWENTRPLPEIDEDLKDVDRIGRYIDVFFKGHLAKMMGLGNAISKLYTDYMKKYTVTKPEYSDEEDSEALFDAIFGKGMEED